MSPENLEINIPDKNAEETEETYKTKNVYRDQKRSLSPSENTRSEGESDRLSPAVEKNNDVFLRFNGCFKNRICSNCGRLDCNYLHCRMASDNIIKDNKPVLKFSVSAILGNEQPSRNVQTGKLEIFLVSEVCFCCWNGSALYVAQMDLVKHK